MKKNLFLLLIILLFIFTGCRRNISISMVSCEQETNKTELYWKYAFPINYFNYYPITEMVLVSSEFELEDITIDKIEILISEKDYENEYLKDFDFEYSIYNDKMIIKLKNCFSEFLSSQEDLECFKKIKNVKLTLFITYSNEKKELTYVYSPRVYKSVKLLDNLLSI